MKTPCFIFYPEILKNNIKGFNETCKKYLKDFKIAYSVKTNSDKNVIETLSKEGCGFEIASLEEINLVKGKSSFVVFNSPCKTEQEIKKAIENNFLINIDSINEIDRIARIRKGNKIEAGIRIGENKFGIEKNKIEEAIKYAESKNIEIILLHFHPGTQQTLERYENAIKEFSEAIKKLNLNPKFIDVGGGFPDKFQLKNLNLNLEDYIKIIARYFPEKTIILEPGRCPVSDAFELITKVHVIKEKNNKKYAILDAGINVLPKVTLSSYQFSSIKNENEKSRENNKEKQEYILAGPLLFSNDELGVFQGNLEEGDLIKVENVGAYCYVLAWELPYKKPKTIINRET